MAGLAAIWLAAMCACTAPGTRITANAGDQLKNDHLVIVTAAPGDSFESLATDYLKDPGKAWWLSALNGLPVPRPGDRIVIPSAPPVYGGLRPDGYQTVPVLLYPRIAAEASGDQALPAADFELHLRHLNTQGFTSVTLRRLEKFLQLQEILPPRAVVICFDGAGSWLYETVYPLMKQYRFKAVVFIATASIGHKGYLTWDQLAEMVDEGWEVGSMGVTGRDLLESGPSETSEAYLKRIDSEIGDSAKHIQQGLKRVCSAFAYPNGNSNDLMIAMLKKYGYRLAFTEAPGNNPFFAESLNLSRVKIPGGSDIKTLENTIVSFHAMELQ